jgi:FKBP-type peptidyl-prolyl cis-trans isomerase
MRKIILGFAVLASLTVSPIGCSKDNSGCTEKTVASEQGAMQAFAATNSITTTAHSSGIQYQIINPGSGAAPTINSRVKVKYTGKFMDGTVFDSQPTNAIELPLNGVIAGWQIGIPLIQKGGTIKLIIPSSLAYGCAGRSPTIPSYSILYFEVELVDVL